MVQDNPRGWGYGQPLVTPNPKAPDAEQVIRKERDSPSIQVLRVHGGEDRAPGGVHVARSVGGRG